MLTVAGFSGTLIQGTVISHCSSAVGNVSLGALMIGANGNVVGSASFRADFGLVQPGEGSPFVVLTPLARSQIAKVLITVVHFDPVSGPVPVLQLRRGAATPFDGGVSVPYTVLNAGTAPAALPRVAGRIIGSGCSDPFVLEFLQDGSPIPPGGSVSGSLLIPSACAGVPELQTGSDEPLPTGLPPGLSFSAVRTFYTADGVLHLIANVCNASPQDAFLPQFRVQFKGSAVVAFSLNESGIYSGDSCAPLLAAIPGAPAGLTFDKLLSATAQTASQVTPRRGALDLPFVLWKAEQKPDPCENDDIKEEDFLALALGFPELEGHPLSRDCREAFDEFVGALGGVSRGAEEADVASAPVVLSFLYNGSDSPLPSSAYRVQSLGYGRDGSLVAGIDIANPPSLSARGWGIGVTPLDNASVVALDGDEFRVEGEGFAIPK